MKGLNEIKNALIAFAKKAKFPDGGKAITTKVKGLSAAQVGKIVGGLEIAKIFDSEVERLPLLNSIYKWWAQTVDTIYSNTVYKIPKVGDFVKFVSDKLGEFVLPNAQKHIRERRDNMAKQNQNQTMNPSKEGSKSGKVINHPSFYGNLDLHKEFSIPGAYTKKTVVNGTMATPKLAVHRVFENPMADRSATIDRLNQKYSLIKAVRGLSATVYNIIDLYNYERFAKLNLLQYHVVKRVVQAAKTYNLVQTAIGDNIIASLGFNPTEVRDNLASYETLLCQMHRFISNNLPVSGTWINRLEYLVHATVPDYSDGKVATIHTFAVSMSDVFYSRTEGEEADYFVFDCIPQANNNSYTVIMRNFNNYQAAIVNNDRWQQLIADYFGAFGAKAMWQDASYPAYKDPINLNATDNDLCREQIKNAFYLNAKVAVITIDPETENRKVTVDVDDPLPVQLTNFQFGSTDYEHYHDQRLLTYLNILDADCYLQVSGLFNIVTGPNTVALLPDHNGVGASMRSILEGQRFISMDNHETIYTLHKGKYSEQEALEISQFKLRTVGCRLALNDAKDEIGIEYTAKTNEYALMDTIVYTFHTNGNGIVEDTTFRLCDESVSDDDLQTSESAVDYPDEMMAWALIDWMPLCHFTFFSYDGGSARYFPRDVALIDMDAFGSLDDRAFATEINYSIYSLQAAGLTIGTKRIDNLAAVYKDKASKNA